MKDDLEDNRQAAAPSQAPAEEAAASRKMMEGFLLDAVNVTCAVLLGAV